MQAEVRVNHKPYDWLCRSRVRFNILYGGGSSGKSHTMAQFQILEKWEKERNIGILVVRKTRPAVKASCWTLVNDYLRDMGYEEGKDYTSNKSDLIIRHKNGNFIMFDGLDNVFKKKSIEGINYIWIEEAAGVMHDCIITLREFLHLDIICRSHNVNGINQIYFTFNPVDPIGNEWLKLRTDMGDTTDTRVMKLNHKSNPFLARAEHDRIEALADQDKEYDDIYRKGLWATPTYIIYTNWDVAQGMPERYSERIWGLDFGYSSNQAALVELRFVGDKDVYEQEWIYETGLTNPQLIEKMRGIITNENEIIVADSAEPKSIQEIRNAGFNIHGCQKGPDSVRFGINAVKSCRCHITAESENMLKEIRGYKWKQDKDERPLPEPLKFNDHLMDAMRYVIMKVKGIIEAGISFGTEDEKVEQPIPDTRDAMLAQRYTKPEKREPETNGEDWDEEDSWTQF